MGPYIKKACVFALSAATALPQWGCVTADHKAQEAPFEGQHHSEKLKRYLEVVLEMAYKGGVPEIRLADLNIFYAAGNVADSKQENCNYVAFATTRDLMLTVPFLFPEPPIAEIFRPDGTIEGRRETETVPKKVKMFFSYDDTIERIGVISVKGLNGWSFLLSDYTIETEPKPRQDPNCSYRDELEKKMLESMKKDMEEKTRGSK